MNVLHHLAMQSEALVILLQETHCIDAEKLVLPNYQLAGSSLGRKHGLATFVHERMRYTLLDQSPLTSEIEWLCVDVDGYKIVNVYKPPPMRLRSVSSPLSIRWRFFAVVMLTGVTMTTVWTLSAWLAGQVLIVLPSYIMSRTLPLFTPAVGTLASIWRRISRLSAYLQTWRLKLSHTKTVTATFYLNNREVKRELKVYNNGRLLPFCQIPTYLGVKLDRLLTFRHHLVTMRKKPSSRITLLRRLVGSEWGAGAKTLRITTLSLVYSTAEYCVPVWCRIAHTRLIDSVLNDALHIVTGCLHPTPTDQLPVLSSIQLAELCRMGATLSLAHHGYLDPDHILYGLLSGFSDNRQARLRSRRPFVSAAWNLLDNLARLGIRASEWTNHKWKTEYCKNASRLRAFVPGTGARPVGMGLPRVASVKLNRLRTGVGRFRSTMHKWSLAPSPNCECGASEQTTDRVLTACPIHRAPHGARGLTVLDDETRCWLNIITASI